MANARKHPPCIEFCRRLAGRSHRAAAFFPQIEEGEFPGYFLGHRRPVCRRSRGIRDADAQSILRTMSSVSDHYSQLLAPVYAWMSGSVEAALDAGKAELDELNLPLPAGALVVDLGAGFGMHAVPLA